MGQLRTANNRRNRAILRAVTQTRAAAAAISTGETVKDAKPAKAAS